VYSQHVVFVVVSFDRKARATTFFLALENMLNVSCCMTSISL